MLLPSALRFLFLPFLSLLACFSDVVEGESDRDCLRLTAGDVGTGLTCTLRSLRERDEGADDERFDEGVL